jgi:hypothetical protein
MEMEIGIYVRKGQEWIHRIKACSKPIIFSFFGISSCEMMPFPSPETSN